MQRSVSKETGSSDSLSVSVIPTNSRSPGKVSFREHKDEYKYERRSYSDSASDDNSRPSSSHSSDISSDTHRRRRNHDTRRRSKRDSRPEPHPRSHSKQHSSAQRPRSKPTSPGTHHRSSSSTTFLPPTRPESVGVAKIPQSGPAFQSNPHPHAHPVLPPQQIAAPLCAGHSLQQPCPHHHHPHHYLEYPHIQPSQSPAPGNLALLPPPGHNLPAPSSRRPSSPSPTATPTKTYTSPAGAQDPPPTLLMSTCPAAAPGTANGPPLLHAPGCPAAAAHTGCGGTGCGCPPLLPPLSGANALVAVNPSPNTCCCPSAPLTNPMQPLPSYQPHVHHSACQHHPQQHQPQQQPQQYQQQHCQPQPRNMAAHVHSGSAAVGAAQWTPLDERMQALRLAGGTAAATAAVYPHVPPASQTQAVTPPVSGPWGPPAATTAPPFPAPGCPPPPPPPQLAPHGAAHFFPPPPPQQHPLPLSLPMAPPHLLPAAPGGHHPLHHWPHTACHQQQAQQHGADSQGLTKLYDETTQEVVLADGVMTRELAKQGHALTPMPEAYRSKLAALQSLVNGGLAAKRQALLQQHAALAARAGEVAATRTTLERQVAALAEDMTGRLRSAEGLKQALLGAEASELAQQLGAIADLTADIVAASAAGPADFLAAYRHLTETCERLVARPFKSSVDVEATDLPAEAAVYGDLAASHAALSRLLGVKDTMIEHLLKEREALQEELRHVVEQYTAELGALEDQCRDYHQRLMEQGGGVDGGDGGETETTWGGRGGEHQGTSLRTSSSPSALRSRGGRREQARPALT